MLSYVFVTQQHIVLAFFLSFFNTTGYKDGIISRPHLTLP